MVKTKVNLRYSKVGLLLMAMKDYAKSKGTSEYDIALNIDPGNSYTNPVFRIYCTDGEDGGEVTNV